MAEKKETIEGMLEEIEETARRLSEEELPLEEAFTLYETGVKKVAACQKAIEDVEKKMIVLQAGRDSEETE